MCHTMGIVRRGDLCLASSLSGGAFSFAGEPVTAHTQSARRAHSHLSPLLVPFLIHSWRPGLYFGNHQCHTPRRGEPGGHRRCNHSQDSDSARIFFSIVSLVARVTARVSAAGATAKGIAMGTSQLSERVSSIRITDSGRTRGISLDNQAKLRSEWKAIRRGLASCLYTNESA